MKPLFVTVVAPVNQNATLHCTSCSFNNLRNCNFPSNCAKHAEWARATGVDSGSEDKIVVLFYVCIDLTDSNCKFHPLFHLFSQSHQTCILTVLTLTKSIQRNFSSATGKSP